MNAAGRIGLFGGTFDPIHRGHVDLALACRAELDLDAVWIMPAALPPHKPAARFNAHHRLCPDTLAGFTHILVRPGSQRGGGENDQRQRAGEGRGNEGEGTEERKTVHES